MVTGVTLDNGERSTHFKSVNAKTLADKDDDNARDEAHNVVALAAAKTAEIFWERIFALLPLQPTELNVVVAVPDLFPP
eukprot:1175345-Prorocentrum_minimum.AAC.3